VNFSESEHYLLSLGNEVETMKLGLENIRALLDPLGNPQNDYLKVQVAGTNGKGSVCAFLDSICAEAGIRTGLYTSPHLVSITERIRIGGHEMGEDEFARLATLVRETSESLVGSGKLETVPTYFEQVTAIALTAFAEAKVKIAILETGLGGRFDATTAANAEIAAFTRIDLDHQEYLGYTIEEIAAEKAAIIRADSRVVIGEQSPQAMDVILRQCAEMGIVPAIERATGVSEVSLGLRGRHQIENARISVLLAEVLRVDFHLKISSSNVLDGLENARHPGRLEYAGRFLFDGAHNTGGVRALAEYIVEYEKRPITLVFGAMRDKNIAEILAVVAPLVERIVITQPSNSRSAPYDELLRRLPSNISKEKTFATDNVASAIDIADNVTPPGGIILVTGSLYLVGEVKKIIKAGSKFEI